MSKLDALRHQVDRLIEAMPTPAPTFDGSIIWLKDLSDDDLDELHAKALQFQEQGRSLEDFDIEAWRASHPIVSREELTTAFLSIDIAAVPDTLLPGYPISRAGYNNLQVNYLQREKYDTSTRDSLHAWYQWRRQVQL